MAKVEGPLFSLGARGKIADAMVFFPWKGRHVVRKWVIPANPQSSAQGDIRLCLGAIGRACSVVVSDKTFASEIKGFMAAGQTWISTVVSAIVDGYIGDGTEFDSVYGDYNSHAQKSSYDTEAAALGLTTFTVSYKGATNSATPGFQLYLLSLYATEENKTNSEHFNRSPYTTTLSSWSQANIQAMVAEFTT
jgi:hypothetical protein